jgi:hypothetical protein
MGVQKLAHLFRRQHRGFAFLHAVLRAPDSVRRVDRNDLTGNQPIKQHPDGCKVLLNGRFRDDRPELFDVPGNVNRLDERQVVEIHSINRYSRQGTRKSGAMLPSLEPPAYALGVIHKLLAKAGCKCPLFWFDLEPCNVQHEQRKEDEHEGV